MKIIAFTGAGISKQSNIPTFMEKPGSEKNYLEAMRKDIMKSTMKFYRQLKANMNGAKPNDAHYAWQSIMFLLSQ